MASSIGPSPRLGRPPIGGTILVAVVAAAAIAIWWAGLTFDGEQRFLPMPAYVTAFLLLAFAVIRGTAALWRWLDWVSARWRVGRILQWALPLPGLIGGASVLVLPMAPVDPNRMTARTWRQT